MAVGKPTETVVDFAVPGRRLLPTHLLDVFDRVEREVDPESMLRLTLPVRVHVSQTLEERRFDASQLGCEVQRRHTLKDAVIARSSFPRV